MIIGLLILAYLLVGFVATMSPAGQNAWHQHDIPPLLYMMFWPLILPFCLGITACTYVNDWMERIIR